MQSELETPPEVKYTDGGTHEGWKYDGKQNLVLNVRLKVYLFLSL